VCDGHNIEELIAVFNKLKTVKGKPQVIIANTVKGKGVSFMENDVNWHSDKISRDQARVALAELDTRLDPEIRPAADFLSPEDLDILRGNG
jgi:transketolase